MLSHMLFLDLPLLLLASSSYFMFPILTLSTTFVVPCMQAPPFRLSYLRSGTLLKTTPTFAFIMSFCSFTDAFG